MAVDLIAAIAFANAGIAARATAQSAAAVRAGTVLEAGGAAGGVLPGGLLADAAAARSAGRGRDRPVGLAVTDPSLEYIGGTTITGADLVQVLNMNIMAGRLNAAAWAGRGERARGLRGPETLGAGLASR